MRIRGYFLLRYCGGEAHDHLALASAWRAAFLSASSLNHCESDDESATMARAPAPDGTG